MFKYLIILILSVLLLSSCAENKTINGVEYRPYGLFNENTCKNDSIEYEASGLAICAGIVFLETIIAPIYIFGYNLYEPVGLKSEFEKGKIKGVVN